MCAQVMEAHEYIIGPARVGSSGLGGGVRLTPNGSAVVSLVGCMYVHAQVHAQVCMRDRHIDVCTDTRMYAHVRQYCRGMCRYIHMSSHHARIVISRLRCGLHDSGGNDAQARLAKPSLPSVAVGSEWRELREWRVSSP